MLLLDEGEERNTISSRVPFADSVKLSMWEEPSKCRRNFGLPEPLGHMEFESTFKGQLSEFGLRPRDSN